MNTVSHEARGFVEGVVKYLRSEGKAPSLVPKIQTLLHKVSSKARKQRQANVESAVTLTSGEKQRIERMLERLVGHPVALDCHVHPALIAGLRIQIGDWIVDTSINEQTETLGELLREANA